MPDNVNTYLVLAFIFYINFYINTILESKFNSKKFRLPEFENITVTMKISARNKTKQKTLFDKHFV